jgi:hypothetical protein
MAANLIPSVMLSGNSHKLLKVLVYDRMKIPVMIGIPYGLPNSVQSWVSSGGVDARCGYEEDGRLLLCDESRERHRSGARGTDFA